MFLRDHEQASVWIESLIQDFVGKSPENNLGNGTGEKAFAGALVGFSRGGDPLYEEYKEVVGPYHWTPREIFALTFPEQQVDAEELTVISWVLPLIQATKQDNRKEIFYPSERWARARIFGEEVNAKLRRHVVEALRDRGYDAVAPQLSPQWERKTSDRFFLASTWSERHAAYASGLGTFGLCDGLITAKGKAMRTGSVVARIQIPPTPRPYSDHREYCLFFSHGSCGKCIPRCPVGAITEAGHDKSKCVTHIRLTTKDYVKTHFGFEGYGCGLCQTKVPCESRIPKKVDPEAKSGV
jgi:epoxyqueuosine reductase QueG